MGGNVLQQNDPMRISFAGDGGDTLQGGNYADHLYGAKGKDTIAGGGGNDYLEGGADDDMLGGDVGEDSLVGGNGADTLIGGAENDTLDGGKGNDMLQGGAGDDVYIIRAGDGQDTILDHEGHNTVIYVDASGRRTAVAMPAIAVAEATDTWRGQLADGGTVTMAPGAPMTATLSDGTQIVVDDYRDGDFGIHLQVRQDSPVAVREIYGDLSPVLILEPELHYIYDDLGNIVVDPALPNGYGNDDALWGSEGDDLIEAGLGMDCVLATGGADWIRAGGSGDYLDGGDGDDVIESRFSLANEGGVTGSRLVGGNGNDRLYAEEEIELSDAIFAAGVTDELDNTRGPTLSGGQGDDILVGADYQDVLYGGADNDILVGGGGNDLILGDFTYEPIEYVPRDQPAQAPLNSAFPSGFDASEISEGDGDIIFGGTGNDQIWGQGGDDWISGDDGDDRIVGGTGSDALLGGAGNDDLIAEGEFGDSSPSDRDVLYGGDGTDNLISVAGDDLLFGEEGDDYISCAAGDNLAFGGDGNDEFRATGSGRNEFHGEAGNDTLWGGSGDDYLDGGEDDDILRGSAGADNMLGGPGNDTFEPFQDDVLEGGEGDDVFKFRLGAGRNTILDDIGSNQIVLDSFEFPDRPQNLISQESIRLSFDGDQYQINFGDGSDEIVLGATEFDSLQGLTLRHVIGYDYEYDPETDEDRQVEVFSDDFVPFSQLNLQQLGSGDDDYLLGNGAIEITFDGKAGDDVLLGASGDDTLIGGPGVDTMDGGDGGDRYVFNSGDGIDVISDSGTNGADTLVFGPGIAPDSLSLGAESLLLRIGDSGDAVYVDGFDANDATAGAIERFAFADGTILSQAQLVGRGFDLYGTDGDDEAFGTNLVDRFHENAGDDLLVGGAGDDVYFLAGGSGHDLIVDLDKMPDNSDTVVLGAGIAPGNLVVLSSAGMLTIAISGTNDRLDIPWQPEEGYAIERVRFADGTVWDQAMLESRAVPASQPPDPGGDAPPADTGTGDAGAGTPAGGETTPTDSGNTPPPDAGSVDAGAGTQTGGDTTQSANDGGAPAATGSVDADAGTQAGGDTTQSANGDAPPADTGSGDVGAGTPAGGDTSQTGSSAPPPDAGSADIGAGTQAGGDTTQSANGGAPPADSGSANSDAGTVTGGDATQIGSGSESPADAALPGEEAGASIEGATDPAASGAVVAGDGSQSSGAGLGPAANGDASAPQNPQTTIGRSQQEAVAAATHMLGAGESAAAPAASPNIANAFDPLKPQLRIEQAASAPSPTPLLTALRPTQPNLQSWLDDWLGPHARAFGVPPETSETPDTGDAQLPSMQDFLSPYLPGDIPELRSEEPVTAEQIAQQYDDIKIWLDANPGIGPGMIATSGSAPERNPFTCIGTGSAGDSWYASMSEFGQTPGMSALGGHALAPLRGIKDGYLQLGIT
ncbi:MAG: calcium-binding protein [Acidobacteriota bacterium]